MHGVESLIRPCCSLNCLQARCFSSRWQSSDVVAPRTRYDMCNGDNSFWGLWVIWVCVLLGSLFRFFFKRNRQEPQSRLGYPPPSLTHTHRLPEQPGNACRLSKNLIPKLWRQRLFALCGAPKPWLTLKGEQKNQNNIAAKWLDFNHSTTTSRNGRNVSQHFSFLRNISYISVGKHLSQPQ